MKTWSQSETWYYVLVLLGIAGNERRRPLRSKPARMSDISRWGDATLRRRYAGVNEAPCAGGAAAASGLNLQMKVTLRGTGSP